MNVKRIVVDEVPENCWNCHLWHHETYGGVNVSQDELDVCKPMERTIDDKSFKPSWCPLEVEDVCEFKAEPPNEFGYVHSKTGCSYTYTDVCHEFIFCPNCGKRIKYVEVE